jgi:hypothetical protein
MRSAYLTIGQLLRINMNSYQPGRHQRHGRGRSRRRGGRGRFQEQRAPAPKQKTFWQRIAAFFGGNGGATRKPAPQSRNGQQQQQQREPRPQRKPEPIEVTSPRLYVGNLSFDATESDLFELFNGVGHVQNAEVVSYRHNQRSKGFAFVQMQTIEEAKRAVEELHDKEFLGRKLVVSGAKSSEHSHG